MYKRELQKLKRDLEEVRRKLTMEHTNFSDITSKATHTIPEGEVTDFIRTRTQNWRDTWILYPLSEMIERIDDCFEGVSAEERARRERARKYGVQS
jgi:hypothetical protein